MKWVKIPPYIYFPVSSYLVSFFFVFVYNYVEKITMIALEWCNPYTIKAQVNMFWNQLGTGRERERYRPIRKSTVKYIRSDIAQGTHK